MEHLKARYLRYYQSLINPQCRQDVDYGKEGIAFRRVVEDANSLEELLWLYDNRKEMTGSYESDPSDFFTPLFEFGGFLIIEFFRKRITDSDVQPWVGRIPNICTIEDILNNICDEEIFRSVLELVLDEWSLSRDLKIKLVGDLFNRQEDGSFTMRGYSFTVNVADLIQDYL